jgi:glycosyltransferase involved in cell wall biosynthesis
MITDAKVSLIVHTRNSIARLGPLLGTTGWIGDRIAVDMESTDGTAALVEKAGFRVVTIPPNDDVDSARNPHLAEARHEWILVLDSDESLSADAEAEIRRLIAEHGAAFDAFAMPRFNSIAGHVMRSSGWYPDHQIRLFRKGCVEWSAGHHRPPRVTSGNDRLMRLDPPDCLHIHHANYASLAEFVERQTRYMLTDRYDHAFDFNAYLAAAHEELAKRSDVKADGDLSTALALLMAWDKIARGIIHWEKAGRLTQINANLAVPFVVEVKPSTLETFLGRLLRSLRTFYRHPLAVPKRVIREKLRQRKSRV